ncbi:DUF2155 domain-containing protein [Cereibacter sphaeroides]|nr:DUF2155 domain-containing protein [Cereibacter sphaeroides]
MIRRALLSGLALSAALIAPVAAQQVDWRTLGEALRDQRPITPEMSSGSEAVLRALDKVSGEVDDIMIAVGGTVDYGRLSISMSACRFPAEDPASDAFAFLQITDTRGEEQVFQGWMIASSPALNALDHPRYDVWVVSCS